MSRRSVQDPSYQAEYEAFCQNREQAQLPYVSYRNFLRQWRRSARARCEDVPSDKGHSMGAAGQNIWPTLREREGGKGSGGVTMEMEELPPLPLRQRVEILPLLVYQSLLARSGMKLLGPEMGNTAFPHKDPECAGSFQDLNEHRISMAVTQALQSGLAVVETATTATAHALMQTFLSSRRGPNDEDLMELLSFPTEQGAGWFRFPFRSPNTLQASQLETAFHGTHMECLHGLMATGRIMPSNDKMAGMRHFDDRQGVYLHKPSNNKHLAQGYAAFIRYGPKHVYLRALC